MYQGYSKETETRLQQRIDGLCKIRRAAGILLATFNRQKDHLRDGEQSELRSIVVSELIQLDQAIEDTQIELDTL